MAEMFAHIRFCCFSSGVQEVGKEQGGQQGMGTALNTSFTRAQESSPRLYLCGLDQIAYGFEVFLEDIFFLKCYFLKKRWNIKS